MMKRIFCTILLAFTLLPAPAWPEDIPLAKSLGAEAFIVRGTKAGLWEKTLFVRFGEARRTLSTYSGFVDAAAVVNHAAHPSLWVKVSTEMKSGGEDGGKVYLRTVKKAAAARVGTTVERIAVTGTAADMDNLAVAVRTFGPITVGALATAGAKTNALRAGVDEGTYMEGMEPKGTVNIIVLTNAMLTDGAMARAIVTVTEAKTAAFEDLHVPSSYTKGVQATGTGTDSVIVVSGTTGPAVTYTGGHSRIGELMAKAVYAAVAEALEKQNGFKKRPAHTAGQP
jgi:adenosylcobinamide hydrolase